LKEPGGKEVPWHQDLNYWSIEPIINVTAWIAIDQVTLDNACLQVIPGSHQAVFTHVAAPDGKWFEEEADPRLVDTSKAVKLTLKPGQFVLFNERILHHSKMNTSETRRFSMGPRFTIPILRIDHDQLFPGHAAILVSGEDYMEFNRLAKPPQE
jgi:ectoine hydroxylase-related dioxygenase (phytanoyl-CoA dioxygenase family)